MDKLHARRQWLSIMLYVMCATKCVITHGQNYSQHKNEDSATAELYRDVFDKCNIRARDPLIHLKIEKLLKYDLKMIQYLFQFKNYSTNPLTASNQWIFQADRWSRVNSYHGEVLLSLGSSYDIMSFMTLSLGVERLDVELYDSPPGCAANASESDRIDAMMYLLMRDFRYSLDDMTLKDRQRVCHEIIKRHSGDYASIGDRCCHVNVVTGEFECTTEIMNPWFQVLLYGIIIIQLLVILFGPICFVKLVLSLDKNLVPYVVKLKDPLIKTVYLCDSDTEIKHTYQRVLDLRGRRGMDKLQASIQDMPLGAPVKVKFERYDILVDYDGLLVEHEIPVGVVSSLTDSLLKCHIKELGPFKSCCTTDIFKSFRCAAHVTWIQVFSVISSVLTVVFAPALYYCRLLVYYIYEEADIVSRHETLRDLHLHRTFERSIITTLTPTHPLLLTFYVIYFVTALLLGIISSSTRGDRMKRIMIAAFSDLENQSWLRTTRMLVTNIIWPFTRYGLLALCIAPFYWAVILPFSLALYILYSLPITYITLRLYHHARYVSNRNRTACEHSATYQVHSRAEKSINKFEAQRLFERESRFDSESTSNNNDDYELFANQSTKHASCRFNQQTVENFVLVTLCVLSLCAILLVLSECVGFLVEMFALTVMGIIVNAGALLRYMSLFILLLVYSYTSYSDVSKMYLKTLQCLFAELKKRCKDIDVVTSLPSSLQENFGFKSQELSEQADYEMPDDLDTMKQCHWLINDLVLLIDSEDRPRLPKDLFQEVCEIRTVGAPGPVYINLIAATQSFLKIAIFVFFVFIVVATFGSVYHVSSTNQMVATMAGGALPLFMRKFFTSGKPELEFKAVSFKNKLEEIIKNYQQSWPIYDLSFEKWTQRDEKKIVDSGLDKRTYYRRASINAQTLSMADLDRIKERQESKLPEWGARQTKPSLLEASTNESDEMTPRLSQRSLSENMLYVPSQPEEPMFTSLSRRRRFDVDILIYLPGNDVDDDETWCEKWSTLEDEVFYRPANTQSLDERALSRPADASFIEPQRKLQIPEIIVT